MTIDTSLLPARFWSKVVAGPNGCWLWIGSRNSKGYGRFMLDGRSQSTHRVAYSALVGEIPTGLVIDHLCRVRGCVNPAHLEPVTVRENSLRGETVNARNASRTHCPGGHPYDEENTYLFRGVWRRCRECNKKDRHLSRKGLK